MYGSLGSVSTQNFSRSLQSDRPICILGLGLIGGSVMRDLQKAGRTVFGWNRSASTVEAACASGFDVSGDLTAVLQRAEQAQALLVLGVPMPALPPLVEAIGQHAPSCGITDVTSVKSEVMELMKAHGLSDRFVGGHPMAGTANSGWDATLEGLFDGAVWVVTHDCRPDKSDHEAFKKWTRIWCDVVSMARATGAAVVPARAAKHDRAVARISHLPHVLAETLALAGDRGGSLALTLAASSFRDGTRVAGTEPFLVRAMCENNAPSLVDALNETIALLQDARASLSDGSGVETLVEEGYAARNRFEARAGRTKGDATNRPLFNVRPGVGDWIAQLEAAEQAGAEITII